jgi:hypothetical protein
VGEILRYWDSELILRAKLFFEDERAADRGEYRETA